METADNHGKRETVGMGPTSIVLLSGFVILSLGAWALAASITSPSESIGVKYESYWQKENWWPYPFFFLVAGPVVSISWRSFQAGWRDMGRTKTLVTTEGNAEAVLAEHVARLEQARKWVILGALGAASLVVVLDEQDTYRKHAAKTYLEQMISACKAPDFGSAWLFVKWQAIYPEYEPCVARAADMSETEYEHLLKSRLLAAPGGERPPNLESNVPAGPAARALAVVMSLQMFGIATLGFLMLFQAAFQIGAFGLFNYSKFASDREARIRLNPRSPIGEFGLEEWNHAWNTFYWLLLPATLMVLASSSGQPDGQPAGGTDNIMKLAVGFALAGPIVGTIVVRQPLLREAWQEEVQEFRDQRLWPLDANWSSKLGMVLAFGLGSYLVGTELGSFIGR